MQSSQRTPFSTILIYPTSAEHIVDMNLFDIGHIEQHPQVFIEEGLVKLHLREGVCQLCFLCGFATHLLDCFLAII